MNITDQIMDIFTEEITTTNRNNIRDWPLQWHG